MQKILDNLRPLAANSYYYMEEKRNSCKQKTKQNKSFPKKNFREL